MRIKILLMCLVSACLLFSANTFASSINIDIGDDYITTPSSYGGAGYAGQWNFITTLGATNNLIDTNGNTTGASLNVLASTPSGNYHIYDSDNGSLLADNFLSSLLVSNVNLTPMSTWELTLTGLENGLHWLVLYAPSHPGVSTGLMSVNTVAVDELVGSWGSGLIQGISYSIIQTEITNGELSIIGTVNDTNDLNPYAGLSGIQLSVTEPIPIIDDEPRPGLGAPIPASIWLFGTGLLGLIAAARRKVHA